MTMTSKHLTVQELIEALQELSEDEKDLKVSILLEDTGYSPMGGHDDYTRITSKIELAVTEKVIHVIDKVYLGYPGLVQDMVENRAKFKLEIW